jgi:hypothetical protein
VSQVVGTYDLVGNVAMGAAGTTVQEVLAF